MCQLLKRHHHYYCEDRAVHGPLRCEHKDSKKRLLAACGRTPTEKGGWCNRPKVVEEDDYTHYGCYEKGECCKIFVKAALEAWCRYRASLIGIKKHTHDEHSKELAKEAQAIYEAHNRHCEFPRAEFRRLRQSCVDKYGLPNTHR